MAEHLVYDERLVAHRDVLKQQTAAILSGAAALAGSICEEFGVIPPDHSLLKKYELPAVILPASAFRTTGYPRELVRRGAASLSLHYVQPTLLLRQNRVVTPDRISFTNYPIALNSKKVDSQYTCEEVTTVSGGSVTVYTRTKGGDAIGNKLDFPNSSEFVDYDWQAYVNFPAEALTKELASTHLNYIDSASFWLNMIEDGLENVDLNPQP